LVGVSEQVHGRVAQATLASDATSKDEQEGRKVDEHREMYGAQQLEKFCWPAPTLRHVRWIQTDGGAGYSMRANAGNNFLFERMARVRRK